MLGIVNLHLPRTNCLNVGLLLNAFLDFVLLELSFYNVFWVFEFRFTVISPWRSFIRPWYELASNFASSRVKLDPSPLAHLRDVFS